MTEHPLGEIAHLRVDAEGDVALAELHGEVDLSNADEFVRRLKEAVSSDAWGMAVDLTTGDYIDSAGIRGLLELQRHLHQRRQLLALVVPPTSPLRSVLELTGIPDAIPIDDARAEAVARLRDHYASPSS